MAVYTGAQDPTVTATYGVAFADRFDQTSGKQYVKGDTTGTDTNWFEISEPATSGAGVEPNTLTVSPGGTAQFTTIGDAIAAVPPGSVTNIKVYPGIYTENLVIPAGIDSLELEAVIDSANASTASLVGTVLCQSNTVLKGPWFIPGAITVDFDANLTADPAFQVIGSAPDNVSLGNTFIGPINMVKNTSLMASYIRLSNCYLLGANLVNVSGAVVALTLNNCGSSGNILCDGTFAVKAIGCIFSRGFASSFTIQNNTYPVVDSLTFNQCFIEHLVLSQISQQVQMQLCELRGLPFGGNCIEIDNAALFSLNTLIGSPNAPLTARACVEAGQNSQSILAKNQIVSAGSPIDILHPSAVMILVDAIISATGVDRAIENTPATGAGFILINAVNFAADSRIAPSLAPAVNTAGSLGINAAGNDTTLTTIGFQYA